MHFKLQSIFIIFSLLMSTLGVDTMRMIAFYNFSLDKFELNDFVQLTGLDSDSEPMEGDQNPFSQYSDIIEKEPQCFIEQYSRFKFTMASSVFVLFLHFPWQNIFLDSMYTPPEV